MEFTTAEGASERPQEQYVIIDISYDKNGHGREVRSDYEAVEGKSDTYVSDGKITKAYKIFLSDDVDAWVRFDKSLDNLEDVEEYVLEYIYAVKDAIEKSEKLDFNSNESVVNTEEITVDMDSGCGGFTAFSSFIALICAAGAAMLIRKK